MKKLVLLGAGAFAIPAAMASAALLHPAVADSQPNVNALNVVGEPYGKAVQILKSQGVKPSFGGSVGSDLPQAQCIVDSQKVLSSGKMILMLNCTDAAAADATDSLPAGTGQPGAAPNVGANGVTTVQATPVGPQPGMNVPGA